MKRLYFLHVFENSEEGFIFVADNMQHARKLVSQSYHMDEFEDYIEMSGCLKREPILTLSKEPLKQKVIETLNYGELDFEKGVELGIYVDDEDEEDDD